MAELQISDVAFFDVETTGLPPKNADWRSWFSDFPDLVSIGWIFGEVEKMRIIKPDGWEIPQDSVDIHGITTEYALEHGVPLQEAIAEFLEDILTAGLICAHNIHFDTSMIKAGILKRLGQDFYDEYHVEEALYKGKRIDTMMKTIKFVGALRANGTPGKYPKLEELFAKLFPGETFEAHNAIEDCRALRRCLPELVELGIIQLEIRQYDADNKPIYDGKPSTKTYPAKVKGPDNVNQEPAPKVKRVERKFDFEDPSPAQPLPDQTDGNSLAGEDF